MSTPYSLHVTDHLRKVPTEQLRLLARADRGAYWEIQRRIWGQLAWQRIQDRRKSAPPKERTPSG